jgi:hypothetical protein
MGIYKLTVTFDREFSEDVECVQSQSRYDGVPLGKALVRQFVDELQEGYDAAGIAGHFVVDDEIGITRDADCVDIDLNEVISAVDIHNMCCVCVIKDRKIGDGRATCIAGRKQKEGPTGWTQLCDEHARSFYDDVHNDDDILPVAVIPIKR